MQNYNIEMTFKPYGDRITIENLSESDLKLELEELRRKNQRVSIRIYESVRGACG